MNSCCNLRFRFYFQLIITYLFKWGIVPKESIHIQNEIVKGMIDIIFFNIKNKILVFFKIVQYKLFFIEI